MWTFSIIKKIARKARPLQYAILTAVQETTNEHYESRLLQAGMNLTCVCVCVLKGCLAPCQSGLLQDMGPAPQVRSTMFCPQRAICSGGTGSSQQLDKLTGPAQFRIAHVRLDIFLASYHTIGRQCLGRTSTSTICSHRGMTSISEARAPC